MTSKMLMRAAVLSALLCAPAFAQVPSSCGEPFPSPAALFEALGADGWETLDPSVARTEALMWINAVAYLGSDMGGATLTEIVEAQRMAAANYGRLKALPTSETRVLSDGKDVMLASWQKPAANLAAVQCRVSLIDPSVPAPGAGFGAHVEARVAEGNPGLSEYRFHYNADAIRAEIPGATPPNAVVNIRHEFTVEADQ
jgi:hypothetical protein